jgi:hypothetical protein
MGNTLTENISILDGRVYDSISLHTALPDDSGSNEISGGTYVRATGLTFSAAAQKTGTTAIRVCTIQPVIEVPGGATVAFIGYWGGSTFRGYYDCVNEVFAGNGQYKVTGPGGTGNPAVELT